ncbi:hypothetical protein [Vulcanococcus limneticus]|uniref:hypothetical protein n=1 Tax=Vulcanococcus limneticus TaxID=2170428 RepID=UPI00398C2247
MTPLLYCALAEQDPALVLSACSQALEALLRHRQPLQRCWIDHPYGEEEITRLEEEVLPALQQFLARLDEIEAELLAAQQDLEPAG